eukprot:2624456-Amphidinium_carterae.3
MWQQWLETFLRAERQAVQTEKGFKRTLRVITFARGCAGPRTATALPMVDTLGGRPDSVGESATGWSNPIEMFGICWLLILWV